jgi:acylphosphatase
VTGGRNKRLHLFVSGRVQGVWYRGSALEKATGLGLQGWVRNRRDGRVELIAEGEETALLALRDWCRHGPRLARVEQLEENWLEWTGEFPSFSQAATL